MGCHTPLVCFSLNPFMVRVIGQYQEGDSCVEFLSDNRGGGATDLSSCHIIPVVLSPPVEACPLLHHHFRERLACLTLEFVISYFLWGEKGSGPHKISLDIIFQGLEASRATWDTVSYAYVRSWLEI